MLTSFNSLTITWLDIIVLIPLCWCAFKGFKNGLIKELASIAALVLGVWATVKFSDLVASWLGDSQLIKILAFVITFITVLVLVYFVGIIVEKAIKIVIPAFFNHLFGLLFGIGKVVIIFSVIFFFIQMIDFKEIILKPEVKEKSYLYKYIEPVFPKFYTNMTIPNS